MLKSILLCFECFLLVTLIWQLLVRSNSKSAQLSISLFQQNCTRLVCCSDLLLSTAFVTIPETSLSVTEDWANIFMNLFPLKGLILWVVTTNCRTIGLYVKLGLFPLSLYILIYFELNCHFISWILLILNYPAVSANFVTSLFIPLLNDLWIYSERRPQFRSLWDSIGDLPSVWNQSIFFCPFHCIF